MTSSGHDIVACRDVASDAKKNFWGSFLYGVYTPGNDLDFELIPAVKMETRHPVNGSLGNEFPSICNHCGVMEA